MSRRHVRKSIARIRMYKNLQRQSYEHGTWQRAAYEGPCLEAVLISIVEKWIVLNYLPPVDLRAVCLVRAIADVLVNWQVR